MRLMCSLRYRCTVISTQTPVKDYVFHGRRLSSARLNGESRPGLKPGEFFQNAVVV